MDIVIENKTLSSFKPYPARTKRVAAGAECVVPDKNEDIGRIVSVKTQILLKSKDTDADAVTVTGEVEFTVLYITENEDQVSWLNVTSPFRLEYELPEGEFSAAEIALTAEDGEATAINPRKLSVSARVCGQLVCYAPGEERGECTPPEVRGLHTLVRSEEKTVCAAVCEKSFVISQQLRLNDVAASRIVSKSVSFIPAETQTVGTKLILKGTARAELCIASDGRCPYTQVYDLPYSQIIETGAEGIFDCKATVEVNSIYAELIDTINNERAADVEIHAVTQVCAYRSESMAYIADAYSNLQEIQCDAAAETVKSRSRTQLWEAAAEGVLDSAPELKEVAVFRGEVASVSVQEGRVRIIVCADVIYKTESGTFAALRRYPEAECPLEEGASVQSCRIAAFELTAGEGALDYTLRLAVETVTEGEREIRCIDSIALAEEKSFAALPALFLVRQDGESLWELAKRYHSTVERIEALNPEESRGSGRMLMIARTV